MAKLILPLRAPLLTLNEQRRAHWTTVAKAKLDTEIVVGEAIKKAKLKPVDGPITVQLVWYAPDLRHRDVDGLAPMAKACLDALRKKGIIADDHSELVRELHLGPIVVSRDQPRFELLIHRFG